MKQFSIENVFCKQVLLFALVLIIPFCALEAQTVQTFTTSGSWTCPYGVSSVTVETWGGGGAGGGCTDKAGGGGGGGGYTTSSISVTYGTTYNYIVGAGGTGVLSAAGSVGGASSFNSTVIANGGAGGTVGTTTDGAGGTGGSGTYAGGNGGTAIYATGSGGGGGGAGSGGAGGNGAALTAGTGTATGGGNGAAGRSTVGDGAVGVTYGGGGSGAKNTGVGKTGGAGASGAVKITYTKTCLAPPSQPTSLILTAASASISGSFTAETYAEGYLVVRTTTSTAPSNPVNGTTYTAGASALGGVIVYSGTLTTFTASSLTNGTQYWFWVYGYNNVSCTPGIAYLTSAPLNNNATAGAVSLIQTYSSSTTWFCPPGVTSVKVECWGAGGAGGGSPTINRSGGGGAGGDYKLGTAIAVTPGTTYTVTVGGGGAGSSGNGAAGGPSIFLTVQGDGGSGGFAATTSNGAKGPKGAAGTFSGGDGGAGANSASGGGGGGGGSTGNGTNAGAAPGNGTGGTPDGGNGGASVTISSNGNNGFTLGGGGSGALSLNGSTYSGGNGANGQVRLTYSNACTAPPAQPTSLILTPTTNIAGSFTAATYADGYLVIRTSTSTAPSAPVNGTTYSAGATALGGYVEAAGTGTTFTSTSLTAGTQYWYWVYAYHSSSCTGGIVYLAASPLSGNTTTLITCIAPASQPTSLSFSPVYSESLTGSFTATTADGYLVIRTATSTAPSAPVNATTYTVGATALGGMVVSAGTSTTWNSITSLTANTQYWYWVYAYNNSGCSGGPVYKTTSPLTSSVTTAAAGTWTNTVTITTPGNATYNWKSLSWGLGHLPTASEQVQIILNDAGATDDAIVVNFDTATINVYSYTMTNQSPSTTVRHLLSTSGTTTFTCLNDMTISSPGGFKYNRSVFANVGNTYIYGNVTLGRYPAGSTDGHGSIGSTGSTPNQTYTLYGNMTFNPRGYTTDEWAKFIFDKAGTQYVYNNTVTTDTIQPVLFESLTVGLTNTTTLIFGGSAFDAYIENVRAGGVTIGANSTIDLPNGYSLTKFSGGFAEPFTLGAGATLRLGGDQTINRSNVVNGITGSNFPSNFSPYTLNATSTVEYYGSSSITQTIYSGVTYGNLLIKNGPGTGRAAKTNTGAVTVNTSINVNALADWNLGNTVASTGPFTVNSTGGLYCATNTVSGAGAFTLASAGYLGMGSPQGITSGTTASGNIQMMGGRSFSTGGNYIYNGTVTQVTGNGLPSTCNDLFADNPTTVTIATSQDVTGINKLAQGTFDIGSTRLKITGNGTLTSTGGKMKANLGILEMNGSSGSAQSLDGSWFINRNISTLMNSNTTGITLAATANDTLIVASALLYGASTTNSTIATNNNLTLLSRDTATARFGEIVTGSGNAITGKVNVERYISTLRKWRHLSWPTTSTQTARQSWIENNAAANANGAPGYGTIVTDEKVSWSSNGFDSRSVSGPSVKYYDPATQTFVGIPNTTSYQMNSQPAYFNFVRGDRTCLPSNSTTSSTILRTTGTLKTGNQSFTITATKLEPVGNPYASAVDFRLIDTANLTSTFYVWDPKLTGIWGLGAYQTIYASGGQYKVMPGGGSYGVLNSNVDTLESGQAFYVRARSSNGTVTFKESAKTIGARTMSRIGSTGEAAYSMLSLVDPGYVYTLVDGTMCAFGHSWSNAVDYDDALKMTNTSENVSYKRENQLLSIERRQSVVNLDTLFLNITGMRIHQYKWDIILDEMNVPGRTAFFIDKYLNTSTPLELGEINSIEFDVLSASGSYAPDRFSIIFKQSQELLVPVRFTSISAVRNTDKTVTVRWDAENEINMQDYTIQYSADGVHFNNIGSKLPTANNGGSASYTYIDGHATSATNYYRIRGNSINGQAQYTAIAKVGPLGATGEISIYPNPITDNTLNIRFENQPKGEYQLQVTNKIGQVLHSETIQLQNSNTVKMVKIANNAAPGGYQVTLTDAAGQKITVPFLIK